METARPAPLIVTLGFDAASFEFFDEARRRHFPPARNRIPAHLTLFHHLPGDEEADIALALSEVARRTPRLTLRVAGLRFLGFGSAYSIVSPALVALRDELASRWRDRLTPQDAAPLKPHVTVQNKVPAAQAKQLFAELQDGFRPFEASGTHLLLWRYRGGPWEAAGRYALAISER